MNRRSLLTSLFLGAGTFALTDLARAEAPAHSQAKESPASPRKEVGTNTGLHHFRIGRQDAWVLHCGELVSKPGQPFLAPEATESDFTSAVAEAVDREGRITMPFNVLLLRWHEHWVLIDTGPKGNDTEPSPILARLAQLGLTAADIDLVVLTHAHFDHMGGLLSKGHPVFSRAKQVVSTQEMAFWCGETPDCSQMRLPAEGMIAEAKAVLQAISFECVESGTSLLPGLRVLLAPGHTPGQLMLELEDEQERVVHISDLCHHAWLLLPHADWTVGSDVDPRTSARQRREIFDHCAATKARVFGFHLPFPGLGRIAPSGNTSHRWVPEDWQA